MANLIADLAICNHRAKSRGCVWFEFEIFSFDINQEFGPSTAPKIVLIVLEINLILQSCFDLGRPGDRTLRTSACRFAGRLPIRSADEKQGTAIPSPLIRCASILLFLIASVAPAPRATDKRAGIVMARNAESKPFKPINYPTNNPNTEM